MYDAPKVITGMLVFLGIVLLPFLLNAGKDTRMPKPELPADESLECVASAEWMRSSHMQLLDDWRHEVVREGKRVFHSAGDQVFNKSLTRTCLSAECHRNKKNFCDRCHVYASVKPYCWECHVIPKERT